MSWFKANHGLNRLIPVLILAALVAPTVLSPLALDARAEEESWKPVTLLFTSDIKGKIDPCG